MPWDIYLIPGQITKHCCYKGCCLYSTDIDVSRINFSFAYLSNHYYCRSVTFPLSFSFPPCSYDFYKLKFYFTIVVFIISCICYFPFDSKDPMWVVWLPFLLTPNHCPFSVTWEILGVEMEDGHQSWRLTAERCIRLLNNYLVYKPALFQNVAS